jgi:hypothetical protein
VSTEYRVRWQREGRSPTTRIYQTEAAALRKIDGILALDALKGDSKRWDDMPDLVGSPELQMRVVGDWVATEHGQDAPSEHALAGIAVWAGVNDDDSDFGVF